MQKKKKKMGPETHLKWALGEGSLDRWRVCGKGFLGGGLFELGSET